MTELLTPARGDHGSYRSIYRTRPGVRLRVRKRTVCAVALAASDALAALVSTGCAYGAMLLLVRGGWAAQQATYTFAGLPLLAFGLLAFLKSTGRYHERQPVPVEMRHVVTGAALALLFNACLEFSFKTAASRVVVCGTWLAFPLVAAALRHVTRQVLRRVGLWRLAVLVVGDGPLARRTMAALVADPALGYQVVGQLSGRNGQIALPSKKADLVVVALDGGEQVHPGLVEALVRDDTPFAVAPPLRSLPVVASGSSYFFSHDVVLLSYRNSLLEPAKRALKVTFDLVVASLLLVVLAPLFIAITLAVRADGGPAFYGHTRVGADGRRFKCLKFRSMVPDSAAQLEALLEHDPEARAQWRTRQKLRHDPRITRIGDWLRRSSLDELPQLLNVLRLEMSLVGPRPIVESEMVHYGSDISYYFEARPGLTGLWQVSGRSDTSYDERVRLDTWYVKNWTLWHDITILSRTVPAVLARRGAR